ncbi:MAG: flippase-like domain-containing protein [Firmicutes bacterium]|nr:flippase-like domain-containing protein [Bacillota bacterium]
MSRAARTTLLVSLAIVVVGALLYRLRDSIGLEGFSWHGLSSALRHVRLGPVLAGLLGIYLTYAVRALRWARFCRHLGPAPLLPVYEATLAGFTALFVLGRAGEPVRPILIARKLRQPFASMFGIYVLERVFDMASTAVLLGLALLLFPRLLLPDEPGGALLAAARSAGGLLLVALLGLIAFLAYFHLHGAQWTGRRLASWRQSGGWRARLADLLAGFGDGLQAIRSGRDLLAAVSYSAVHWFLIVVIYDLLASSFGGRLAELGLPAAVLVLVFSMVGSMVQLPGIGGGAQVATFVAYTVVFGVEKGPAAAAAILIWLVTFAACTLAGIPLLVREGWSVAELRRLARAEVAEGSLPPLQREAQTEKADR